MMTTIARVGLLVLVSVFVPSCGGAPQDAAPPSGDQVEEDAVPVTPDGGDTDVDVEEAPAETSLLEFTGSVRSTGTEGMRMVNLRADDGTSLGLVGDLAPELATLSGAVVTVRGEEADAPAGTGLDVTEYEIVSVNGETPSVGILEMRSDEYWLAGDSEVHLDGVPAALAEALGAKVWVTGPSGSDRLTVQSYGIIRPN